MKEVYVVLQCTVATNKYQSISVHKTFSSAGAEAAKLGDEEFEFAKSQNRHFRYIYSVTSLPFVD